MCLSSDLQMDASVCDIPVTVDIINDERSADYLVRGAEDRMTAGDYLAEDRSCDYQYDYGYPYSYYR